MKPATPIITNNSPICANEDLTFSTAAAGVTNYVWSGPSTYTSVLSSNTITNTVEADHEGTYTLTVDSNGCTSNAASFVAVINAIPQTPTLTTNSPICEGANILLNTDSVLNATYTWTALGVVLGGTTTAPTTTKATAVIADAGTYGVTATVNGCTSPTGNATIAITATPAAPTVSNSGAACEGGSVTVSASTTNGGFYNWSGPSSFTSAMQAVDLTNIALTDSGYYVVSVTVDGCTSDSDSTDVTVHANPTIATPTTNAPICEGTTLTVDAATVASVTYSWTGPGNFNSSLEDISIAASTEANNQGEYSLVITDATTACSSTPVTVYATINPTPEVIDAYNNGPACEGENIALGAPLVNGATYAWAGPNGYTATGDQPMVSSITAADSGYYVVQLTVNGCVSAADSTWIAVNATPAVKCRYGCYYY